MKIIVDTLEFKNALEKILKVSPNKARYDIITNVMINTDKDTLYLSSTNLNQYARIKLKAECDENIKFVFLNTKNVLKGIKFFKDYCTVIEYIESSVILSSGNKKLKQAIYRSDGFPEFPEIKKPIAKCVYSNRKLKKRFNAIKYAVSCCETKPVLQGICFNGSDMVAIDGFRVAINRDDKVNVTDKFVVPTNAITYTNNILDNEITITRNSKYIKFSDKNEAIVISRLCEGEYLNYLNFINDSADNEVYIDIESCRDSLKYLQTFATKNKFPVSWYNDKIGLSNSDGYFESVIDVNGVTPNEITFNGHYLLDVFSQFANDEKLKAKVDDPLRPIYFMSDTDSSNFAMILPLRAENKLFQV